MAADQNNEVVEAETRPDTGDEVVETRATDMGAEVVETKTRPDLVWDNEAPGLRVRVYGDGAKSFIFVYRLDGRQRFVRIGNTPIWSHEAARSRAKELRSIVNQGRDPASHHERDKFGPVENVIRYIAEYLRTE